MTVVAEGVETDAQLRMAKPLDEVLEIVEKTARTPSEGNGVAGTNTSKP